MRAVSWLAVAALVVSTPAAWAKAASGPSATRSTAARGIALVGQTGGEPDAAGAAIYVVRDAVGNPVVQSVVWLDFSRCTDIRLASDYAAPNTSVDCSRRSVIGVTDVTGAVTFKIVGSGAGGAPRTVPTCASAYADGVPLPPPIISAFDLDGTNGVDGRDLAIAASDLFSGEYRARSDFDADGHVDGLDLGILAHVMFTGGSQASGSPCPP